MDTDERYALLANRAALAFVTAVCVVSVTQRNPWLLVFAPTEHALLRFTGDSSHRFSCFCTTCASFAWLAYAYARLVPFGLAYAPVALEALVTWDVPLFRVFPVYFACTILVWVTTYLAPALILVPAALVPLIERKWLACLLRLPAVCLVLAFTTHA